MKYGQGFTLLRPSISTVASMVVSVMLLGTAVKTLPVGSACAIWVGIGAVGTANLGRLVSMALG